MKKTWLTTLAIFLLLGQRSMAGEEESFFNVVYFPEATYAGERSTFIMEGPAGAEVVADIDGKEVARGLCEDGRLEMNMVLTGGGMLSFRQGDRVIGFHIIPPGAEVRLREDRGYLYSARGPAILLAQHIHPPKHDRRWETLTFLKRLFSDSRPVAFSGNMVLPDRLFRSEKEGWESGLKLKEGFWHTVLLRGEQSEMHMLITSINRLKQGDILVVALSDSDLEQGADYLQLRIKLEWYLQRVGLKGHKHVFLVGPCVDDRQRKQFGPYINSLRTTAAGNKALLVRLPSRQENRPWRPGDWASFVVREIERRVRLSSRPAAR